MMARSGKCGFEAVRGLLSGVVPAWLSLCALLCAPLAGSLALPLSASMLTASVLSVPAHAQGGAQGTQPDDEKKFDAAIDEAYAAWKGKEWAKAKDAYERASKVSVDWFRLYRIQLAYVHLQLGEKTPGLKQLEAFELDEQSRGNLKWAGSDAANPGDDSKPLKYAEVKKQLEALKEGDKTPPQQPMAEPPAINATASADILAQVTQSVRALTPSASARSLVIARVPAMLDEYESTTGLEPREVALSRVWDQIEPLLFDPMLSDVDVWTAAGRVAVARGDTELGAFSIEAIERLRPDAMRDAELSTLLGKLKGLGLRDRAEGIRRLRSIEEPRYKAALAGELEAVHFLARCFQGVEPSGTYRSARAALAWYTVAADNGYGRSMVNLASMHEAGRVSGIPDPQQQRRWLGKAMQSSDPYAVAIAASNLANATASGRGAPKDLAEAQRLYEQCYRVLADAGDALHPGGKAFLANALWSGFRFEAYSLPQNRELASKLLHEASAAGWLEAARTLCSRELTNKSATTEDKARALRELESAWTRGNVGAGETLGAYWLSKEFGGDADLGRRWLERAAADGSTSAMRRLASALETGDVVNRDQARAVDWWTRAAWAGDTSAMVSLGVAFDGGHGVKEDKATSFLWLLRAARAGDATAMFNVGKFYHHGLGVAKDDSSAARWFRRSAESGNSAGKFYWGKALITGLGVASDDAAARRWFNEAASELLESVPQEDEPNLSGTARQSRKIQLQDIAEMYRNGWGVDKDDKLAEKFDERARRLN